MAFYEDVPKVFFFVFLSVFLFFIFDGVIYSVSTQIRQPIVRLIFKYSMLCLGRFVFYGFSSILSLIFYGFNSASIYWIDTGVIIVLWINIGVFVVFNLAPRLLPCISRKHLEYSNTDQEGNWIWYHHELIIDHALQLTSYENAICIIYDLLLRLINWRRPNQFLTTSAVVKILGNDRMYDPAWPRCSIAHSIAVIRHCDFWEDNRLLVLRTSFFRQQSRLLWSYPLPEFAYESTDQLTMQAFENGGLIFIFLKCGIEKYLWIIHLETEVLIPVDLELLFPGRFFTILFVLRDDGSELGDDRDPSSIYVRLIYCDRDPGVSICYSQSLIEVSVIEEDGEYYPNVVRVLGSKFDWPTPWDFNGHRLCQTSSGQMGMKIRLRHPVFGQGIGAIFWDPNQKNLVQGNFNDLVTMDRPLRLFTERYPEIDQLRSIVTDVLNDSEAMVVQKDWSVWRTSFQPPSLKSLCLEKVFGEYKKKLEKCDARQWMEMTGVDASAYFQGDI